MIKFAKSLSENMKDESYLAKYIPIRTADYLGNFDITINDLFVGDNAFGKAYTYISNVSPGNIAISNLDIANNSISAILDPVGRIVQFLALDEVSYMDNLIPMKLKCKTLYSQFGDICTFLAIIITLMSYTLLLASPLNNRNSI